MRKKPMLAYPVSDKPIDYTKPVYIQPKLDGVRCLIQANKLPYEVGDPHGGGFEVKAYSRTSKEWKNIKHILDELVPFFNKYPNVILDGELYNHDLRNDFESIISMVRKQKPHTTERLKSHTHVQFHCYDIVREDIPFNERNYFISKYVQPSYCVKHVTTMAVGDDRLAKMIH